MNKLLEIVRLSEIYQLGDLKCHGRPSVLHLTYSNTIWTKVVD